MNIKNLLNQIEYESTLLLTLSEKELENYISKLYRMRDFVKKDLNELLIPCFSLVQEIASRTIGLRHYKTQIIAGLNLHNGNIVEMKTGEGKTLVSTLPLCLNGLSEKGAHLVTTNEYLAERDQKWMKKIYDKLNLSIGLIKNNQNIYTKRLNYNKNITYVTSSELVFDYLRDHTITRKFRKVQTSFNFCLIDEADSILIDEAKTPLIISQENILNFNNKIYISTYLTKFLENLHHFTVDIKRKEITLTEQGNLEIQSLLGINNIYDTNNPWTLEILNALKAKYLYKKNKDYVILHNKIAIIDEFTGRIMADRRWSFGLHEAIEAKENLPIGKLTSNKASITYQNFFPLYPKYSGMTGTALSSLKEFKKIYNLNVIKIPPYKQFKRIDLFDKLYISELSKWKAVITKVISFSNTGQPILIGTSSIEKSEYLSKLFFSLGLPHKILNAKPENAKKENEIIAQAGKLYSITIATNMAGRGTDILLGGNLSFLIKEKIKKDIFLFLKKDKINLNFKLCQKLFLEYKYKISELKEDILNLPYSLDNSSESLKFLYGYLYNQDYNNWLNENQLIKQLGGLFVLGTEKAESQRIDDQLRGRSGRQGDPGTSEFYLSLEDNLLKTFGGENLKKVLTNFQEDIDLPLNSNLIQNNIYNAQQKIENYYFEIRENLFNYESILNFQRKIFYNGRQSFFEIINYEKFLKKFMLSYYNGKNLKNYYFSNFLISKNYNLNCMNLNWCILELRYKKYDFYRKKTLKDLFSFWFLEIFDNFWLNHIENILYIKETINWNSYGQQNPLDEYIIQSEKSYNLMFKKIVSFMIYYLLYKPIFNYVIFY